MKFSRKNEEEKYGVLPLIPLRDVVVFPSMATAIIVGRQPSVNAVERAIETDKIMFVVTQKDAAVDEPEPEDLYMVGTIVKIGFFFRMPDGTIKLMLEGISRARVIEFLEMDNYRVAKVEEYLEVDEGSKEIEALSRKVETLFEDYVKMNPRIPQDVLLALQSVEARSALADTIAGQLLIRNELKQQILESFDLEERLLFLIRVLNDEIELLKVERDLDERVSSQVSQTQKEIYLHEKMKAIKQELGQTDEFNEYKELKRKIRRAKMSREAEKVAYRELDRLRMMSPMAPEASVVRSYIETLVSLPWKKRTNDNLDLEQVKSKLDADHYGLAKVKNRILEFLAVVKLVGNLKGPILCFVGPPGVGKTSLGRSIAEALGRRFVRVSLGGVRDEAEIRGHRRTYIGSMPGRIIQSLRKAGTKNPVFLLDEIDKLGADFRGDPSAALLEVLDPDQNKTFSDHYLEVDFDLSEVMFITTANVVYTIPPALQDRMEIIRLPGYMLQEKIEIARRFLLPKQLKQHGLTHEQLKISKETLKDLIEKYTREAGVRSLERELASICRKVAKKLAVGKGPNSVRITRKNLESYLGVPVFSESEIDEKLSVGVATGLAWTEAGGEILNIEVTLMPGKGELILTGQLGEVMQESAKIALSYARNKAQMLPLPNDFFSSMDVHVHVPEGAIPKDGPSAGVAIATALVSAFFDIPVRRDVAMTGEVTLRGKVLPVGGVNEKSVAAMRAGVKKILLPKGNKKNIKELPQEVRKNLKISTVESMDDVLSQSLSRKLDWGIKHRKSLGGFFEKRPQKSTN
ncbi:MAG: endopeptidase La [Candidatus Latescibacteria bacterium 4484_7]|nr:MAG: endopeptidase La [Candidatus Latescibacteria bacterium 4484_7]